MGKITADWMVEEETQLLETLRLLANTKGLAEAMVDNDAEVLRELSLPIAINYAEEQVDILDNQGMSILSMQHQPGGKLEEYTFSQGKDGFTVWPFVQHVLAQRVDEGQDKYAGLAQTPQGNYFYVTGPVFDDTGEQVGAILVGKSLETLVREIRQNTLAHTTIYDFDGRPLVSTLPAFEENPTGLRQDAIDQILTAQDTTSTIHPLTVASVTYSEILGPWEVRKGEDLGVIGASLAQTFVVRPSQTRLLQIFTLVTIAFLCVITIGIYLARRITKPLLGIVYVSGQVAAGNLDVKLSREGMMKLRFWPTLLITCSPVCEKAPSIVIYWGAPYPRST